MTINVSLAEASHQFLELIERIKAGEEVLVSEAGISIARIVPAFDRLPRISGQDKGKISIAADFDDPLPPDVLDSFLNPANPQP
jgi:antitoxin (DNA-binding transcriptional repressor) of toxin-antitoxin stability system